MENYIYWGGIKLSIPEGFKHVKWAEVKEGDQVHIIMAHKRASRPHIVHSVDKRMLRTIGSGRTFFECSETLLVKG